VQWKAALASALLVLLEYTVVGVGAAAAAAAAATV
jgi:hypothetical protein